ncbi:T-complex protein 1 subunit alpha [Astathelohania contejeani]|uniref:T-complex protein 1 subunit alpha n=1 Tax=Astathelohania contejeani TaxID=164912 RepID=A0ABQ7HX78_9MICR|nr:T-complex protein 1 subunit alpha [Thelohania contejeani]
MKELSMNALFLGGEKITGVAVRERNTRAVLAVANAIRTSYGPLGLDKMCVDSIGEVIVTNDGATILRNMNVEDPAARIVADLAHGQDQEVGDGTTGVVLLASALVERGTKLIASGLHASTVVSGYKMAFREAKRFLTEKLALSTANLGPDVLANIVKTCISSKAIKTESNHFCKILVEAVKAIEENGTYKIENINILKKQGGSMKDSFVTNGYVLNCSLASTEMAKKIDNPRIICIDFDLQKIRMPLGVNVVVDDPSKLEDIRKREMEITRSRVKKILDSGANVILSTRGIDDMCVKQIMESGAVAVRRVLKKDLDVIAQATGTDVLASLADLDGEERIKRLGVADSLVVQSIGDRDAIFINSERKKMASLVLRGANEQLLDEMERSVHDALCVLKRTLESKSILPAGGAVEAALSIFLDNFASTISSKEFVAIHNYAEALLELPKTIAVNAGLDANELVAQLMSIYKDSSVSRVFEYGIDVTKGIVQNNIEAGVIEPAMIKIKSIRSATEAAISILRIDEIVTIEEKPKPEREMC